MIATQKYTIKTTHFLIALTLMALSLVAGIVRGGEYGMFAIFLYEYIPTAVIVFIFLFLLLSPFLTFVCMFFARSRPRAVGNFLIFAGLGSLGVDLHVGLVRGFDWFLVPDFGFLIIITNFLLIIAGLLLASAQSTRSLKVFQKFS